MIAAGWVGTGFIFESIFIQKQSANGIVVMFMFSSNTASIECLPVQNVLITTHLLSVLVTERTICNIV